MKNVFRRHRPTVPGTDEGACGQPTGAPNEVPSSLSTSALARGSLTVLFAQGLQSLRGVLLLPFITRMLSAGDYGLWVQAGTLTSLLSPIATLYLGNAILRFFAAETDPRGVAGAFHGVMVTVTALAVAVTGAALLGSAGVAAAFFEGQRYIVSLALASLLPECLASVCLAYFRTFRQMGRFSFFSVALPYVELVAIIILLLTGHPLEHIILAMAVVRAVLAGVIRPRRRERSRIASRRLSSRLGRAIAMPQPAMATDVLSPEATSSRWCA